jgi:hypothetical protein
MHPIALERLLRSPTGAVAKDMLKRGYKVQARAKMLISGEGPRHPSRVDTGATRSSIQVTLIAVPDLAVRIGSKMLRARWIHDGTGIYGPLRHRITPNSAQLLRFKPKGSKNFIYVKSIKGMRKNEFLKDALSAAK